MTKRMIGPLRKRGPKTAVRVDLIARWGLTLRQARDASRLVQQLAKCKSDEARRLLLGVSEKGTVVA